MRCAGGKAAVGIDDSFHIGSCTKAMTATLCAILIQQQKLKWDSTIGEVLADQREKIRPEYHNVTLQQLLMHRSGLPEDRAPDPVVWPKIRDLRGPMLQQRRRFVELALSQKPTAAAGEKFQYSNAGYTIAGAMCERIMGKTWEELMRKELFKPLGMTTAGFGPPGAAKRVDQPCGHLEAGEMWLPVPPGPLADNPAVIGPAGTVHCSLADWAKFAMLHVRGEKGKEPLLPAEVFRKLHTATDGEYAFGWVVTSRPWAGGTALTHAGSNTMWMAVIWLAPKRDEAFLAATNVGAESGFTACDAAISELIKMANDKPQP